MTMFTLQQVPLMKGCHAFSRGVQPTQNIMAEMPDSRFMETMANQMNILVLPRRARSEIMRRDMANDVLLHAWLQMASVTQIWPMRKRSFRFSKGICQTCLPTPRSMARSLQIEEPRSAVWEFFQFSFSSEIFVLVILDNYIGINQKKKGGGEVLLIIDMRRRGEEKNTPKQLWKSSRRRGVVDIG